MKSSREKERMLDPSKNKYLTTGENRNSYKHFESYDKVILNKSGGGSVEDLRRSLHLSHLSKNKKVNKINSKLMNIFCEPTVNDKQIESATLRSQESVNTLFNIHVKSQNQKRKLNIEEDEHKHKPSFEKQMKKILDTNNKMNLHDSAPKDSRSKDHSMKLYKFFLNKLLTTSNDPFFNKKHQAFLLNSNLISSGPNFYERMSNDVSQRNNKDQNSSREG
jgi:hypothetical protein